MTVLFLGNVPVLIEVTDLAASVEALLVTA